MTDNDKVPELTEGEFLDFVKEKIVLIEFFAEWCMPCLMMAPIIDDLSEKFKGKINFGKVNIDSSSNLVQKYEVSSVPTLIIFQDNEIVEKIIGAISTEELESKLNKILK